jgi:hypothetical protein
MKAQKYKVHISTNDLPFDGFDPTGGPVFKKTRKYPTGEIIGFISSWDIVKEIAIITLFEQISLTFLLKKNIITKGDILTVKLTDEEVRDEIKSAIKMPFVDWLLKIQNGVK